MSEPTEKFLPCPFCGSEDLYVKKLDNERTLWVTCGECDADGPMAPHDTPVEETRGLAIRLWNCRHDAPNTETG